MKGFAWFWSVIASLLLILQYYRYILAKPLIFLTVSLVYLMVKFSVKTMIYLPILFGIMGISVSIFSLLYVIFNFKLVMALIIAIVSLLVICLVVGTYVRRKFKDIDFNQIEKNLSELEDMSDK